MGDLGPRVPVLDGRQLDEDALGILLGYFPVESRWASQEERGRRVAHAVGELAVACACVGLAVARTGATQGQALAGAAMGFGSRDQSGGQAGEGADPRVRVALMALLDSETVRVRLWRILWLLRGQQRQQRNSSSSWHLVRGPLAFLELINFLIFLVRGRFPTLAARVLGLRTLTGIPPSPFVQAGAQLVGQTVLWEELSNTLHALMPILRSLSHLDVAACSAFVRRTLGRQLDEGGGPEGPVAAASAASTASVEESKGRRDARVGSRKGAKNTGPVATTTCKLCGRPPVGAELRASSCGHRFCYYCARATLLQQGESRCPHCQELTAFDSVWPD